jgi:hypothetical protein
LGEAIASDEQHGTTIGPLGSKSFGQALPSGFDLVAFHLERKEVDVPELWESGERPDFTLEIGADDQADEVSHLALSVLAPCRFPWVQYVLY